METSTATGAGRSAPAKNAPVEATGKSATRASVSSSFHSSYPTTPEGYEILDELGHGDNSAVYRAVCPPMDHESVAIKIVNLEGLPLSLDALVKEIRVMSLSSHDNVVPYSTSFVVGHHLWIVMPFISGTPMGRILRTLYPQGLGDESVIRYILHEALKGLNYFHRNKQIHRNLKADNIHLTTDGRVLLTDYTFLGLMLESGVSRRLRQTFVGTPCWMAPEVMEQVSGYDYKADVWSLGITALELAQGQAPYERYAPMKILQLTLQGPVADAGASRTVQQRLQGADRRVSYDASRRSGRPPTSCCDIRSSGRCDGSISASWTTCCVACRRPNGCKCRSASSTS
ncbi:hypothetical protein CDCA_CDCA08G2312 [Cyanidium caldarium]|uniref:Protein kinase domain-containing protein n=1 Tax=Cyanidium caldarium TaxID=2771 RepID=A0AAV9IVK2_CYACA|nr:hypothetical protein CDCA_CDCA08G2312 [Cyanidium caldarium]